MSANSRRDNGRRRRRSGGGGDTPGAPLWMVTYSDMVTLLLTFFILLFAFSEVDVSRLQAIMSSFQAYMGVLDGGMGVVRDDPAHRTDFDLQDANWYRPELERQLREIYEEVEAFVVSRGLEDSVQIGLTERGVVVRFADQVLFDLGRADLKDEAMRVLDQLAEILDSIPNHVRVEGHTDDLPINNERFPSNWELSTARATKVLHYLIEELGRAPNTLSAAGYGEYRPLAPNDSAETRARNRRVDIVLLRLDLEE